MGIPGEVLEAYGLGPDPARERAGGTKNENYRVTSGDRSVFLRRRHPDYADEGWIRFDHGALFHLARSGAPVLTPLPLPCGGTWLRSGEGVYEAYPWVEGDPFPGGRDAIRSAAENLARFHRAGAGFPGTYRKGGFRRGEMAPSRLLRNLSDSMGISPEGDETALRYREEVIRGEARLSDAGYDALPQLLIHGDVQPANTIFRGSDLTVFVDVDWMSRQPAIYDLAYGLILFCGRRERPIDGADIWSLTSSFAFDEGDARAFLETYAAAIGELPPALRPALMEQVRLTWAHIRIDGARKVPAEDRPRFLARDPEGPFRWIEARRSGDWF